MKMEMGTYRLIHGYQHNDAYRASFNQLAQLVFGLDFESWYRQGYWTDEYTCFSCLDGERVVANVSVSRLGLICQGESLRAMQIGTVMTHPDYRGKGLAAGLMRTALEHCAGTYDLAFLFANKSVLNFYPRFGFRQVTQHQFSAGVGHLPPATAASRRLDLLQSDDLATLLHLSRSRVPVSQTLGVVGDTWLLMFYCLHVCGNDLYYLPAQDAVAIYRIDGETLRLYDIIAARPFDLDSVIGAILSPGVTRIKFEFTPDDTKLDVLCEDWQTEDGLFILPAGARLPQRYMFPALSQA